MVMYDFLQWTKIWYPLYLMSLFSRIDFVRDQSITLLRLSGDPRVSPSPFSSMPRKATSGFSAWLHPIVSPSPAISPFVLGEGEEGQGPCSLDWPLVLILLPQHMLPPGPELQSNASFNSEKAPGFFFFWLHDLLTIYSVNRLQNSYRKQFTL